MKLINLYKTLAFTIILGFSTATVSAQATQKIGGDSYNINPAAILELESTTKGFLPPRMTLAQMENIVSPPQGMMVYCTNCGTGELRIRYSTAWGIPGVNLSGDVNATVNLAGSNVTTIQPNVVNYAKIQTVSANTILGNGTGSTTNVQEIATTGTGSVVLAVSPVLTGTPTAPTATAGTNTTQLATTAFVTAAASSSNFVDLTTAQTIAGIKTFSSDAIINGLTVGRGNGIVGTSPTNTAVGRGALFNNTAAGSGNTAIGQYTLRANISGDSNTAIGSDALTANSSGQQNTALGIKSLFSNTIGSFNTASGVHSLYSNTDGQQNAAFGYAALETIAAGSDNAVLGAYAGRYIFDGETSNTIMNKSVLIGGETKPLADNGANEIVIGFQAVGNGSNTMQLGNPEITNVKTSGTITAGTITYPKAHGTSGQVLSTTGSGTLAWLTPSTTATAYSGILPLANGGTGSSTQNFVDLTTAQTVAGVKTFSSDMYVNGLAVGRGLGNIATNTALGKDALLINTTGFHNTALGVSTLKSNLAGSRNTAVGGSSLAFNNGYDNSAFGYKTMLNNTTGDFNVSVGSESLSSNTTGVKNTALGTYSLKLNINGASNTAVGYNSLTNNTSGQSNTASGSLSLSSNTTATFNSAFGSQALEQNSTGGQNTAIGVAAIDRNTTGANNAVLGAFAGRFISDGTTFNTIINNSVLIGSDTRVNADNQTNQIVIGYGAIGNGSNTVQLGNTSITNVKTSGTLTADAVTYPKAHGTSGQVLSTTGSGTLTWTTPSTTATAYSGILPLANGGTGSSTQNFVDLTTAQTVAGVKTFSANMIVNGIKVGTGSSGDSTNTAVGSATLSFNTGVQNTAIGSLSLTSNISGVDNTAIGSLSLTSNISGVDNTAVGFHSLTKNTASNNTAVGMNSSENNTTGVYNSAFGVQALQANISGAQNTAIGVGAIDLMTSGNDNVAIGYIAGRSNSTGNNVTTNSSILIGSYTKTNADNQTNQIVIGHSAIGNGSNTVQLGNTSITNVKTSGTLTADAVTYPKAHGTSGQVLSTTGSGTLTWTTPSTTATAYSGILPLANGGTGSSTQNFVDLTTDQTIAGNKTFTGTTGGITPTMVGLGNVTNTSDADKIVSTATQAALDLKANLVSPTFTGTPVAVTASAGTNTTQLATTAFVKNAILITGYTSPAAESGVITGFNNVGIGPGTALTSYGHGNTSIGAYALQQNTEGNYNTAIGYRALYCIKPSTPYISKDNVGIGNSAGVYYGAGWDFNGKSSIECVYIGSMSRAGGLDKRNEIVIGYNAVGNGSNTVQLGNTGIANVKTSGTITAGTITYPNTKGSANQVLTTDGIGIATWTTPSTTATAYSGILPLVNGGTGSSSKNFVDLTTAQSVEGLKTFSSIDGLLATGIYGSGSTSSLGAGTRMMWYPKKAAFRAGYTSSTQWDDANIGIYSNALGNSTTASGNISIATGNLTTASGNTSTAMGYNTTASGEIATTLGDHTTASGNISIAMGYSTQARSYAETVIGTYNTDYTPTSISLFEPTDRLFVIGNGTLATPSDALVMLKNGNTTISGSLTVNGITISKGGSNLGTNTAIGKNALAGNTTGLYNTANGESSLLVNTSGSYNTTLGFGSGSTLTTGSENTLIGVNAATSADGINATAIGFGATASSNTVRLGNNFITNVITAGKITAGTITYPNTDGTSGQVLSTNGTGNATWTTVAEVADEFIASAAQTSFTLTQTPSANSKVKMYVNGIRISNTAYSWSGTTLIYIPANNGNYTLVGTERIQFDYHN